MEAVHKFFFALVFLVMTIEKALAAQHVVGGSQGWDESTDYSSWASGQTFKVGDQLVFKYTSGLHSVVELGSKSAYDSCDISSAVNSMNDGNSVVKLTKAGTRYFACGTMGHCDQGMKVKITTVAADASSTPASSSSSSSSTTSTSAGPESHHSFASVILMASSLVITMFLAVLF